MDPTNPVTAILEYGTPGILLVVLGVQIWLGVTTRNLVKSVDKMQGPNGVVWKDVFAQLVSRVKMLEERLNAITT